MEINFTEGTMMEEVDKEIEQNIIQIGEIIRNFETKKDLAEQVWKVQPFFFDNSKIWWLWNLDLFKWQMVDETDILNMVDNKSIANTINSKHKSEIIEAFRQYGRRMIPKDIKKTWIQFKDIIIDIETGERLSPSPKYFVTNPIPFSLSGIEETPIMDKIFTEWVGKENIKLLYQIIAFSILPDYFLNRIFCFMGSGMNGKSKYLELVRKFVGFDNCCTTELDTLMTSRFEVSKLYKKLICQMGETDFNEMNKTSMLKKLSGGDMIGYEFKNKKPFEDLNYSKIMISTNSLPSTADKTVGFYRRWMIIDFPNQFSEARDILNDIPEEEYNNLATKSIGVLKELLEDRKFHNEGSIEERKERYEQRSNFLEDFLKQFTEEDPNGYITKSDFSNKLKGWSKENNHREMGDVSLSKAMTKLGVASGKKHFSWMFDNKGGQARIWEGIKWKD